MDVIRDGSLSNGRLRRSLSPIGDACVSYVTCDELGICIVYMNEREM